MMQGKIANRILITNDDGINAPGIAILEAIARRLADEVWVVAPEHDRSGAGQSISRHTGRLRVVFPGRVVRGNTARPGALRCELRSEHQ